MTTRRDIHTGDKPYIAQFGHNEQLLRVGSHLHVARLVLPGFTHPVKYKSTTQSTRGIHQWTLQHSLWVTLRSSANIPRQLRQSTEPTQQEEHKITHMPYKRWCPVCVKAKGKPTHHKKGALKEQSLNWTTFTSRPTIHQAERCTQLSQVLRQQLDFALQFPQTKKVQLDINWHNPR
eukprot:191005-Amphidinium_carterae.1